MQELELIGLQKGGTEIYKLMFMGIISLGGLEKFNFAMLLKMRVHEMFNY